MPAFDSREGHGPLSGVTVLDLSGYVAGPYGCTLLGDQGALVIKIEPPEGDNLRNYPSTLPGESRAFLGVNRNKRGIGLDLKHPDGVGVLRRMVERADVLVHNFRPSVPARLGIDYDRMRAVNARLIYCALTGYGDRGPLKDRAGYDQVLQTMTGICVEQGKPGDPEIVYGSAVDFYSASMLAFAVSSALFERSRTGRGQYVSVSLLRSALTMQATRLVWADGEGRDVARDMRSGGITGIHPTKHGSLYISANTPHFWKALCELTGLPELAGDPRFDTVRKRAEHAALLVPAAARGAAGAHRAGVGGALRRARALRGGAPGRGHVRSSAGGRRRHPGELRAPGRGPLPRHGASGALRRRPAARALRGAAARAALAGDPGEPRLLRTRRSSGCAARAW